MQVAILGRGKTGGKVIQLCQERNLAHTVFSTQNPVRAELLKSHDVVISFLPGEAFLQVCPYLLEAKLPVVSGSTGIQIPSQLIEELQTKKLTWIQGHNFSLGMNLIHSMIKTLSQTHRLFEDYDFKIHEIHHTKKLDAPSGTALKWSDWLNLPNSITSERQGDIVGDHQLTLTTPTEKIILHHQALDRTIFASGALWAAQYLLNNSLQPGLHWFENLAQKELL